MRAILSELLLSYRVLSSMAITYDHLTSEQQIPVGLFVLITSTLAQLALTNNMPDQNELLGLAHFSTIVGMGLGISLIVNRLAELYPAAQRTQEPARTPLIRRQQLFPLAHTYYTHQPPHCHSRSQRCMSTYRSFRR